MVVLFLFFFEESPYCFPLWHQCTFPPTVYKGSCFFTSSSTLVIYCLFDASHSDRCEMISHCGFFCVSLMVSDDEHLFFFFFWWASFQVPIGHLCVFGDQICFLVLCPLLNLFFFNVELCEFFVYFEYWPFIKYIVCTYLLLFSRWPFHFVDSFLPCTKVL